MLREKLKNYNIILASKSPRRQQFLKDLDVDFTVETKDIEEIYPKELKGVEITDFLANLKSKAFANLLDNDILITSDTIVWLEEKALGKPKNENDAFLMLKSLSGREHEVITSVSIKTNHFQKIISDITTVSFKELTDKEIMYYIKNFKPFDKAGSYGIQDWFSSQVKSINGCYYNVMGLPLSELFKRLLILANK